MTATPIPTSVSRPVVRAFYQALASRDPIGIARFIDNDVRWTIVGPVDVLQFCGERRGKRAVIELFERVVPAVLDVTAFVPEILLVDGDRAASFSRIVGTLRASGHTISYRCAHFIRFRADKVIECSSIIDSFDAAEQVFGHPIDLTQEAPRRVLDVKDASLVSA
jgi:ketosteroid isomerase-like protein